MKAVVLGATGHIGNAVLRELLTRGWEVTAASRRAAHAANLAGLGVTAAPGDADAPGQLDRWVAGQDLVVDAAAPYPTRLRASPRRSGGSAVAVAERRTSALLEAVRRQGARLVYVSSFVTLRRNRGGLDRLRSRAIRKLHDYFAVKEAIEARVLDACDRGLRAVVVNPTACFGPWDLKPRELAFIPRLLAGEIPAILRQDLNAVDVRDVAAGIVHALESELYGRPLLLSGHNVSFPTPLCAGGSASWAVALRRASSSPPRSG